MPLRDHFHSPLDDKRSWDELHGAWPTVIVIELNKRLPPRYAAGPRVHLGGFEIDVAAFNDEEPSRLSEAGHSDSGGVATALWSPPKPTLAIATDLPDQDEYEVRVYDTRHDRRLVAVVEIVSPSNKDRPESRALFVAKCAAFLRERVSVAIVDLVTSHRFNLYAELLELIGHGDATGSQPKDSVYAAACRWRLDGQQPRLETWAHPLALAKPLPTLPLWLADNLAVPLDLEASYEETCRILRMA